MLGESPPHLAYALQEVPFHVDVSMFDCPSTASDSILLLTGSAQIRTVRVLPLVLASATPAAQAEPVQIFPPAFPHPMMQRPDRVSYAASKHSESFLTAEAVRSVLLPNDEPFQTMAERPLLTSSTRQTTSLEPGLGMSRTNTAAPLPDVATAEAMLHDEPSQIRYEIEAPVPA